MSEARGESSESGGLRPVVSAACRRALVGVRLDGLGREDQVEWDHIEQCAFCAARVRAASGIAAFASQRPEAPQELAMPALLDSIYERATEDAEQGVLGQWVALAGGDLADGDLADGQLAGRAGIGSWQDAVVASPAEAIAAAELSKTPPPPLPEVWSGVRRSILAGVVSDRAKLRTPRHWRVMFAGAAAIMVIGLVSVGGLFGGLFGSVPNKHTLAQPVIGFADFDRAPDVEFAIARYGRRR